MSLDRLSHSLYSKARNKLRDRLMRDSDRKSNDDLGDPDEIRRGNPTLVIYNSFQEDTSSKPENTEQKQGGDKFMTTDEDEGYDLPEGLNEDIYEALEGVGDALYQDAQQRGLVSEEVAEELVDNFYGEVVPAVEDLEGERDEYEEELVDKLGDFEDYVRHNIETREELAEEVADFGTEISEFAEGITLHGSVPEGPSQKTSELVDDITGRDEDEEPETDGGWFGLR